VPEYNCEREGHEEGHEGHEGRHFMPQRTWKERDHQGAWYRCPYMGPNCEQRAVNWDSRTHTLIFPRTTLKREGKMGKWQPKHCRPVSPNLPPIAFFFNATDHTWNIFPASNVLCRPQNLFAHPIPDSRFTSLRLTGTTPTSVGDPRAATTQHHGRPIQQG
jgi:hypothetical protein